MVSRNVVVGFNKLATKKEGIFNWPGPKEE